MDTLGLLLKVLVTEANVGERDGAAWLLLAIEGMFKRLTLVWANGGYQGVDFAAWIQRFVGLRLQVIERDPGLKGFQKLPRRWVVERTLGWWNRQRRLSKDYEELDESSEAWIYLTMIGVMARRLARVNS